MNIFFENILGEHVFNNQLILTKKPKKHVRDPKPKELMQILTHFKDRGYFNDFRKENLRITKEKIKKSVTEDLFIVQCSNSIYEINKTINTHVKRLREWVGYPMPELCEKIKDNDVFVEQVVKFTKPGDNDDMSQVIDKEHLVQVQNLAKMILTLIKERDHQIDYMEKIMEKICPNLNYLAGTIVGGKLLALVGSLERLAMAPASKIQLLGAEEALFRHLRTGARPPKHGIIHEHPFVSQAKHKGKAARQLADKISIAVKVDFFKGEFIANKLREGLNR